MNESSEPSRRQPERYTSIIYFHGMGTPKRYEELSRVLETLDRYGSSYEADKHGVLRGQTVGVEVPRGTSDEPVNFLRFTRLKIDNEHGTTALLGRYRLYENYWTPAAAGAVSWLGVLAWLITRAFHPLGVVGKPWRAHQRLKRSYLSRMFYDRKGMPALRYRQIAKLYNDFEGLGARRRYREGRYWQFQCMISDVYAADERARADLLLLASQWHDKMLVAQLVLAFLSLTLFAAAAGLAVAILYLSAALALFLGLDWPSIVALVGRAGAIPAWMNFGAIAALVFFAFQLRKFLELFLSDVVFWTTTFEKDIRNRKRREILSASEDTLMHVIADPHCERIVILGHSLGTAIAYQTLLNLGRRMTAERNAGTVQPTRYDGLRKISHFITMGSPIDRINYFFQLTFSQYHRFNRVADELMGRSSDAPFRVPGDTPGSFKRVIQWVNVRDASDPVASRLFSPRGIIPNRDEIQEVQLSSSHIPAPAGAHTGYFESVLGAKVLYDACILGRDSLQLQLARPKWSLWAANELRVNAWTVALAFAWSIATGAVGYILGSQLMMYVSQSLLLVLVGATAVIWAIGWLLDRVHRLTLGG